MFHEAAAATLYVDGVAWPVHVARLGDRIFVYLNGETFDVWISDPMDPYVRGHAEAGDFDARAPMPGSVVSVAVSLGDVVRQGDTLVIIESMKLEVSIKAGCDGTVAEIACQAGRTFEKGDALVKLIAKAEH